MDASTTRVHSGKRGASVKEAKQTEDFRIDVPTHTECSLFPIYDAEVGPTSFTKRCRFGAEVESTEASSQNRYDAEVDATERTKGGGEPVCIRPGPHP